MFLTRKAPMLIGRSVFFVCPCCDEIVDEDDWTEGDYDEGVCPICGHELLY